MKTGLRGWIITLVIVGIVISVIIIVFPITQAQAQEITAEQVTPFNSRLAATTCLARITVSEEGTTNVISGATVDLDHLTIAVTDQNGQCSFYVSLGQHTAYASKFNASENQCFLNGSVTFNCSACGNAIYANIKLLKCACPTPTPIPTPPPTPKPTPKPKPPAVSLFGPTGGTLVVIVLAAVGALTITFRKKK